MAKYGKIIKPSGRTLQDGGEPVSEGVKNPINTHTTLNIFSNLSCRRRRRYAYRSK